MMYCHWMHCPHRCGWPERKEAMFHHYLWGVLLDDCLLHWCLWEVEGDLYYQWEEEDLLHCLMEEEEGSWWQQDESSWW